MLDYCMSTNIDSELKSVASPEHSLVEHPKHYNRENAIECIDEMELIFGPEMVMNFCLGNVFKYRYRAGLKNDGYQDLEKSDWYMRKYKELKEKINAKNKSSYTISACDFGGNEILCNNLK